MMKYIKQVTAILLLTVMLITLVPTDAMAATAIQVYVIGSHTYIYKTASTSSAKLQDAPKGAVMLCGATSNGWAYVKYNGVYGYTPKANLAKYTAQTTTAPTTTPTAAPTATPTAAASTVYAVTTASLKVYTSASTSSVVLVTLPAGKQVECLKVSGSWARVKFGTITGYVLKSYLKPVAAATPTPGITSAPATQTPTTAPTAVVTVNPTVTPAPTTTAATSKVVITTTATKLYKSASTAASYYGTIPKGATVSLLKISGSWARIKYSAYTGYVPKSYLTYSTVTTTAPTATPAATATATPTPAATSSTDPDLSGRSYIICYIKSDYKLYSSYSTSSSVKATLTKGDKVKVYVVKNSWAYIVTANNVAGYVPSTLLSKNPITVIGTVYLKDWFSSDIQKIFSVNTQAVVTDVDTGLSFNIRRRGGLYHADCEPLTLKDTKTMYNIYNNKWSWDRHAIWVTINGVTYAASMNGMAHGEENQLSNGFDGHFCIHFVNSRTHSSNKVDPDHQNAIKKAYNAKH